MKLGRFLVLAAVAVTATFAADVNVVGAQRPAAAADTNIRIATKDLLNNPTALLNKNTVATDNNVFIARSNVVFTQNDRLALRTKVEDALHRGKEQSMAVATLAKDVMRVVSAPDTDTALMTKASAVVTAKGDPTALAARIADFVDAAGQREIDNEQAIQSQTPRGVIILVGTKDILRQPTGIVNKNIAVTDNQIVITRSTLAPSQNDQVALTGGAKVADAVLPAAAVNVGQVKESGSEPMYRQAFVYPKHGEADGTMPKKEQFGLWGPGWGLGWRYPIGYWNLYGGGLYGGGLYGGGLYGRGCGLGLGLGGFYYC